MKPLTLPIVTIAGLLAFSGASPAALTLLINPDTEQFALTGSTTGTPAASGGFGTIGWVADVAVIDVNTSINLSDATSFVTSVGTPGGSNGTDTNLNFQMIGPSPSMTLSLGTSSSATQEITGTGVWHSYSSLSAINKAALLSTVGSTMLQLNGTGFETVSVVSVPEPSGAILAAGGAAMLLLRRTRRTASV